MKINLGCGPLRTQYKEYVNCDKDPKLNPDKVLDVAFNHDTDVLPWTDHSVIEVRCENLFDSLKHVQSTRLIREIYRILQSGGEFVFHCGDSAVSPDICLGSWPFFVAPYTELFFRHFDADHDAHKNWKEAWNLPGFLVKEIKHNDRGIMIGTMIKL